MKVSLNMAQHFSNVDLKKLPKAKLLEKIGSQIGSIEETVDWGQRFDSIVVVKVIESIKHPNADKLHICKVDDGNVNKKVKRDKGGLIQVVCGAPNVIVGMLAVWIPPGATVPSTFEKEPLVLEARELRGVVSNGMLASPSELGFSDNHDGLLEIKPDQEEDNESNKPGTLLSKLYELDDLIIDIENKMFTHRPDCFGVLGVAREIAGIQDLAFKSPDWYLNDAHFPSSKLSAKDQLTLEVKVQDKKLIPRFMAVVIKGIKVKPSTVDMQAGLSRVGVKPINNIVDITNFFMHLTGQPMHAYDYDKVVSLSSTKAKLIARRSKKGEKIILLGNKEVTLDDSTIVISTDKKVIGIGGVMGGADTEVDGATKNIILECATFDMYSIRRASMKFGLFTDAVTRFNKGQSPLQNDRILAHVTDFISQTTGGEVASEVHDEKTKLPSEHGSIKVTYEFINKRLGTKMTASQMQRLLLNVEFQVTLQGQTLKITPPFWRMDIHTPEDIVEEVLRLYGFDKLPVKLPNRTIKPATQQPIISIKQKIRNILKSAGANEVLTYSFVHENLLEIANQDSKKAYKLSNAISPDLQYYRLSLTPSLIDKVHSNIRSDYIRTDDNEFAIFEINKVHSKDFVGEDKLPIENEKLALVFATDEKTAKRKYQGAPYYMAVSYLTAVIQGINLMTKKASSVKAEHYFAKGDVPQYAQPYDLSRSAILLIDDNIPIGIIGEFKSSVASALKLPKFCAGFEVDLGALINNVGIRSSYKIPKFPKITQDVSYKIKSSISMQEFHGAFQSCINQNWKDEKRYIINYELIDLYQEVKKDFKTATMRMWFWDYERTLTTVEINKFIVQLSKDLDKSIKAERI